MIYLYAGSNCADKGYVKENGSCPFRDWLDELDSSIKYRVQARILKLRDDGYFGMAKGLGGGLYELKFKTLGGGIRIYYGMDGKTVVILLMGGNKNSQNSDINRARRFWHDYIESNKE